MMAVGQFRIDIKSELQRICDFPYRLVIIDKTEDELMKFKDKPEAKIALKIIEDIDRINTDKDYVDDLILEQIGPGYIVATQDRELKRKVKERGVATITIRQKKHLQLR